MDNSVEMNTKRLVAVDIERNAFAIIHYRGHLIIIAMVIKLLLVIASQRCKCLFAKRRKKNHLYLQTCQQLQKPAFAGWYRLIQDEMHTVSVYLCAS